jgi:hypothetical protein
MSAWIRFTPGITYPVPAETLELTEKQAHELRRFTFETLTCIHKQVMYFTVRGEQLVHYVRAVPATAAGRREREEILSRYGVVVPVHAGDEVIVAAAGSRYYGHDGHALAADPDGGFQVETGGLLLHFEASEIEALRRGQEVAA